MGDKLRMDNPETLEQARQKWESNLEILDKVQLEDQLGTYATVIAKKQDRELYKVMRYMPMEDTYETSIDISTNSLSEAIKTYRTKILHM